MIACSKDTQTYSHQKGVNHNNFNLRFFLLFTSLLGVIQKELHQGSGEEEGVTLNGDYW